MSTAIVGTAIVLAIVGAPIAAVLMGIVAILWEVAIFWRLGQ